MKKVISVVMILAICVSMLAMLGGCGKDGIVGKWYDSWGDYYEFKSNGKFTGDSGSGKWDKTGNNSFKLRYDGDSFGLLTSTITIERDESGNEYIDILFTRYYKNEYPAKTEPSVDTSTTEPTEAAPVEFGAPEFDYYEVSSNYNKDENNYSITYDAFDENINTCWQDGVSGYGEGETLTANAYSVQLVSYVEIRNGYQKTTQNSSFYNKNSRVKDITVLYEGGQKSFTLKDEKDWQRLYLDEPVETTYVTIRIDSVYEGSKYKDTCISDIRFG